MRVHSRIEPPMPEQCPAMEMTDLDMRNALLDARAYHVFRMWDKRILYDVRTGVIAEVKDPFAFDLLAAGMRHTLPETVALLSEAHSGVSASSVTACVRQWTDRGLLQVEAVPGDRAERIRKLLMEHHPCRIQLFIAQACNMKCIYCYAEDNGSNARDRLMSFDEARHAIDHLIRLSGKRRNLTVQFFGGEPFMNFGVMREIVAYAKRLEQETGKRFGYQVSTNATLLTEEMQDFVVAHDMGTLVSIDGDERLHNLQRPFRDGSGSYAIAAASAVQLNNKFRARGRITVKARANVIRGAPDPASVSSALMALGFSNIGISAICARPGGCSDLALTAEDSARWQQSVDGLILEWLADVDAGRRPRNAYGAKEAHKAVKCLARRKQFGMPRCGVGRNTNAVDVDGNVYPCHRYVGLDNYVLGTTRKGLDEVLVSSYYEMLINHSLSYCRKCWARAQCGGLCPWEISLDNGRVADPMPEACSSVRHQLALGMYLFMCLAERHPNRLRSMSDKPGTVVLGDSVALKDLDRSEL